MNEDNVEEQLIELEKRYWRAMVEGDADTCLSLTDDPCLVAGAQGVALVDRDAMATMLKESDFRLHAYDFTARPEVRRLADDVVVLAYPVHEDVTMQGQRMGLDAAESSTWIRRDGRWLCAMHTESLLDGKESKVTDAGAPLD